MTEIIPLHPESYDAIKTKWDSMQVPEIFCEWMEIKDDELKEALKVYVRNRMGKQSGFCLR